MPDDKLTTLYNNLRSKNKDFTISLGQFKADMSDPVKRSRLHGNLPKYFPGFNVSYDQFSSDMGYSPSVKPTNQPVQTQVQQPVQKPVLPVTTGMAPLPSMQDQNPVETYQNIGNEPLTNQRGLPGITSAAPESTEPTPIERGRMYVAQQKPKAFVVDESGNLTQETSPVNQPVSLPEQTPIRVATMEEVDTSPEKQKELYTRGKELQNQGDIQGSTDILLRAFEGNPTNPNTAAQLSYNYAQQGDLQKTLEFANVSIANESAIPNEPGVVSKGNYGAYQLKSWAETQLGNPEAGYKAAQEAIRLQNLRPESQEYHEKNESDYYDLATSYSYAAYAAGKLGDQEAYNKNVSAQRESIKKAGDIEAAKSRESYLQFVANGGLESYDVLKEIIYPLKYAQSALESGYETVKGATSLMNKGVGERVDFDAYIKPINNAMNTGFSAAMALNPVSGGVFQAIELASGGLQETTGIPTAIAFEKFSKPFTFISKDVFGSDYTDKNQELSNIWDTIGITIMLMGLKNASKAPKMVKDIRSKMQESKPVVEEPTVGDIANAEEAGRLGGKVISRQNLSQQEAARAISIASEASPTVVKAAASVVKEIKSKSIKSEIESLTKKADDILSKDNITNAELVEVSKIDDRIDQLNRNVSEEVKKQAPELDKKISDLRSEREALYKGGESGVELQQKAAREAEINSELKRALMDRNNIRNKILEAEPEAKVTTPVEKTPVAEPVKPVVETKPKSETLIKELDEIEKSTTPDETRRMEIIKELRDNAEPREGVFSDIDSSMELRGKEFKEQQKRLREKHGDLYEKARSITNNFDDIVSKFQEKYDNFKKICP